MRFMVLIKATEDSEAGVMPSEQLLTEMGQFNEEFVKAGVMLAGDSPPANMRSLRTGTTSLRLRVRSIKYGRTGCPRRGSKYRALRASNATPKISIRKPEWAELRFGFHSKCEPRAAQFHVHKHQ